MGADNFVACPPRTVSNDPRRNRLDQNRTSKKFLLVESITMPMLALSSTMNARFLAHQKTHPELETHTARTSRGVSCGHDPSILDGLAQLRGSRIKGYGDIECEGDHGV